MRILHVIPGLDYSGSAKQLSLLARTTASDKYEHRICVLGGEGPLLGSMHESGAALELLNWTRALNPLPLWRLRRLIRTWQPDVIHAWQMPSVRALALVGKRLPCPWIVQASWSTQGRLNKLDAWLLRRATRVIAAGRIHADWLYAQGLRWEQIVVVPPGVEGAPALGVGERLNHRVMCAGRLEDHKGFYDAVWAVDILKYVLDDIRLELIGDGPERRRLEHFVQAIRANEYVHFLGSCHDASEQLSGADVVWIPSRRESGVNVALEAMARGKPVVASAVGTLREIITHGATGFLVPPQDKAALARCTRLLLDDHGLRNRLALAGREAAVRQFSAAKMADCFSQLYRNLAA